MLHDDWEVWLLQRFALGQTQGNKYPYMGDKFGNIVTENISNKVTWKLKRGML